MKNFLLSCILISVLSFDLLAIEFNIMKVEVDKTIRVDCGDSFYNDPISKTFYAEYDDPGINTVLFIIFSYDPFEHVLKGYFQHSINLPGLTGEEHSWPGTRGYITKRCIYKYGYVLSFEPGSSDPPTKTLIYCHNEILDGSPCAHTQPEE